MPGLLRGIARTAVVAGTASHVAGNVNHRQQKKWAAQDSEQEQASDQDQQPEAAPTSSEVTDEQLVQLDKLGTLKEKGILTQAEFDAKKQQILGL